MIIEACLASALVLSYAFDCQAVLVRTHRSVNKQAEFQALAGLIQYVSRIFTMVAIFAMSLAMEAAKTPPEFAFVFGISSTCAVIIFFFTSRSSRFCSALNRATKFLVVFSFRSIADQSYWETTTPTKPNRLAATSFATTLVLLIAAVLPFLIAAAYPQYRMTSVYAGQLLNFAATTLVLAIQDPHAMRMLDTGKSEDARYSLVLGRLAAHALAAIVFFTIDWQ